MKNLSKTIERILKIEPTLEARLVPIKLKWEKTRHSEIYWEKLIKILNSEIAPEHPKRNLIQGVFNSSSKTVKKPYYTFEPPSPVETIIGVIPEHLEGHLRKIDRQQVEYAKKSIEAKMTHNRSLMVEILKKSEQTDIEQKRIWLKIKNHFNIWDVGVATSYFIRVQSNNLLVLTALKFKGPVSNQGSLSNSVPENFIVKMDEETFKKFFRFMNPPDTPFSESE